MSVTLTYREVWEWVAANGVELINYYWNDFNPTNPSLPSPLTSMAATNITSSFDLTNFQPWHEVWCAVFWLENDWDSAVSFTLYWDFQRYANWSRETTWSFPWSDTIQPNWWYYYWWMYFGVDDDEIRDWYTNYRIRWRWAAWWETIWPLYTAFTVYNLNIDSNLYTPWCLWIEWDHLCYTDSTWYESWHDGYWYLHRIAYDSDYYIPVGTEYAWSIWFENQWITAMRRIYYVTEDWYLTRTYWYQQWYGTPSSPWTQYAWCIRVPTWDMQYWYWHLCYITADWEKLRVLNWPPVWYV